MSDSRMQIQPANGQLELSGSIDETSGLLDLLGRAQSNFLALDLAGITFINSLGVRDWIRMQAAATKSGIQIELRRAAEVIIHQLNMIIATRGNSRVTSFYAPYACDSCGREESQLIDVAANAVGLANLVAPSITCPECAAQMAFNDFPERYFSFLVPETPRPS